MEMLPDSYKEQNLQNRVIMELFILYKIEVVAAPMVRSAPRYEAFPDGFLDWYSRLVGHWLRREIQIQIPGLNDSNYLHQGGYF